jgi:hypothetical protein
MQRRSPEYQEIIDIVLDHREHGILYNHLVFLIAELIGPERASRYRLRRLKRTPSETAAETAYKGQRAIARYYIDAAHRNGRILYYDLPGGRVVFPDRPPTTGGQYAQPTKWRSADTGPDG